MHCEQGHDYAAMHAHQVAFYARVSSTLTLGECQFHTCPIDGAPVLYTVDDMTPVVWEGC